MKKQTLALTAFSLKRTWPMLPAMALLAMLVLNLTMPVIRWGMEVYLRGYIQDSLNLSGIFAIYGGVAAYVSNRLLARQGQRSFLFSLPLDRGTVCRAGILGTSLLLLEPLVHGCVLAALSNRPDLILAGAFVDFTAEVYGMTMTLLALQLAGNTWGILTFLYAAALFLPIMEHTVFERGFLSEVLCPLYHFRAEFFSDGWPEPDAMERAAEYAFCAATVLAVCIGLLTGLPRLAVHKSRDEAQRLSAFPRLEGIFCFFLTCGIFELLDTLFGDWGDQTLIYVLWQIVLVFLASILTEMASRSSLHVWENRRSILRNAGLVLLLSLLPRILGDGWRFFMHMH